MSLLRSMHEDSNSIRLANVRPAAVSSSASVLRFIQLLLTQFSFAATLPHCAPAPWDFRPDPPVHFPSGVCPMHRCFHPPPFVPCPCLVHCILPDPSLQRPSYVHGWYCKPQPPVRLMPLTGPAAARTVRGASGRHAGLKCPECRCCGACGLAVQTPKWSKFSPLIRMLWDASRS